MFLLQIYVCVYIFYSIISSTQVLDMHAYEARQKEYALNGHRHFYFMTLNGSEVGSSFSLLVFLIESCS